MKSVKRVFLVQQAAVLEPLAAELLPAAHVGDCDHETPVEQADPVGRNVGSVEVPYEPYAYWYSGAVPSRRVFFGRPPTRGSACRHAAVACRNSVT